MRFRVSTLPGSDGRTVFLIDGKEVDSHVGVRILRIHKGWTQQRMGEAMGVSSEIVRKWESGRYPVPAMAIKLMGYILTDKVTHPPHTGIAESAQTVGL